MRQKIGQILGHLKGFALPRMTKIPQPSSSLPYAKAIADASLIERSFDIEVTRRSRTLRTGGPCLSVLLVWSVAPPLKAAPPPKGITESTGFWTQAVAEGNLSSLDDRLSTTRLWLETQGRFNNANSMENMNFYQGMMRTAMGYALTDRLTLWAGHVGAQDAWPAIRYSFPIKLGTVTLREMVEMRFIRGDAPGI